MTGAALKRRALLIGLGVGAALAGAACGDDAQTAGPTASAPKPRAAADAGVAIASTGPQYIYSYNALGKRDPFRAFGVGEGVVSSATNPQPIVGCDEPLCQFDMDELTLVAVVSGDANPMAMVEDKSGIGYLVRRNSRMGKQGGKVTQILRDCIVVTSFIQGADGKAQPNRTDLCVKQEQQAGKVLDLMSGKNRE